MNGLLLLLLGVALLFAGALPAAFSLRIPSRAALLVAALVIAAGEIVLLTIVLSLVPALQAGWMLLGQAALAGLALAVWQATGRPRPRPFVPLPHRTVAIRWARANPAAAGMAVVGALALALQLVMALAVAPNNWDSMTYHLARVAYWLQLDSALHFDGGTVRQLASPPNGEYVQGWTMLLSGGDRFANAVQWTALVGLAAAIGSCARLIGFTRPAALLAASLFVVMPQPILQATSTQNDLIVSFFLVAALLFGLRGLRDRASGDLVLFGAAFGLAMGVKGTALLLVPMFALGLGFAAWRYGAPRRLVMTATAAATIGFLVFGAFNYALNQDTYGHPLGDLPPLTERTSPLGGNVVRSLWTLADSTGVSMPWLDVGVRRPVNKVVGDVTTPTFGGYSIDTAVQEDTSAYGLLGVLALAVVVFTLLGRRTSWDRRLFAATAVGYFVLFVIVNEYNVWLGRLMMPGMAVAAPLLAGLHRWGWSRGAAVALALLSLFPSLFVNPLKPLFVEPAHPTVFALDRVTQQTLPRPEMATVLGVLDARFEPDTPLGLVRGTDSWDYPLFGERLQRRVVLLAPEEASGEALRRKELGGILFANVPPPAGLDAEEITPGYWLIER